MSRLSSSELRWRAGKGILGIVFRKLRNMIRRHDVTDASSDLWTVRGYTDDEGNEEGEEVEMFDGLYFAARPHLLDRAEVIVMKIGGESGHPVGVGSRAHDTRKIFDAAEGLAAGECAMFNRSSMVKIRADGAIQAGSLGGTFASLATKEDLQAVVDEFDGHRHDCPQAISGTLPSSIPTTTAPGALAGTANPAPAPAGTQKLEAE